MDDNFTRDDEQPQGPGEVPAPAPDEDTFAMTPEAEALADAEIAEREIDEPMARAGEHHDDAAQAAGAGGRRGGRHLRTRPVGRG